MRRGWPATAGAIFALAVAANGLVGCASSHQAKAGDVRVVVTTSILGDVVSGLVKCAGGKTTTIIPAGADPHDFSPSAADVTKMVKADLVITNGLQLEETLQDAIRNAAKDGAKVFEVAPQLDPIPFTGGQQGEASNSGTSLDPHFWQDVSRMAKAVKLISAKLGTITKDQATFDRCGTELASQLTGVDTQVRQTLSAVPAARRVLITDHDALGYLAKAYEFQIAGVVIPGGSTLATPSSAEIANLVKVIREKNIPVIFSNTALSANLDNTVAKEAGTQVKVVPLFVDSLGKPGSGGETYQAMVLTNAKRIAEALAG